MKKITLSSVVIFAVLLTACQDKSALDAPPTPEQKKAAEDARKGEFEKSPKKSWSQK